MSTKPVYDFEYVTSSTNASPATLQGSTYWYDSGTTENGFPVYYDTSDTYAYFYGPLSVWLITAIADVGTTPTDRFEDAGSTLTGAGSWTGTITISTHTIADAWYRAETTAFSSLASFVGAEEGQECFRGFLPVRGDGDESLFINVWQMTSGGSGEFVIERTYGAEGNWCSLRADARIESEWESREMAMKFSGAVVAWLKASNNLNQVGNVTWCTLADVPGEPEVFRTTGKNRERYWRQTIDLELVYKTENIYN